MPEAALQDAGRPGTASRSRASRSCRAPIPPPRALMFLRLMPFDQRAGKPEMTADAIAAQINASNCAASRAARPGVSAPAGQRHRHRRRLHACRSRIAPAPRTPQQLQAVIEQRDRRGAQAPGDSPDCSPPSAPTFPRFTPTSIASKPRQQNVAVTDIFQALAGLSGRLLHQRFQLSRPHLACDGPGRRPVPRDRCPESADSRSATPPAR